MFGTRRSLCAAFVLYAVGALGLLAVGTNTTGWQGLPALLAIGLASGFVSRATTAAALGHAGSERVGVAAGVLNAARQVGAAVGVALFGSLTATFSDGAGPRLALWLVVLVSAASWGLGRASERGAG